MPAMSLAPPPGRYTDLDSGRKRWRWGDDEWVGDTPTPGWYTDLDGSGEGWYWDGDEWTDYVAADAPGSDSEGRKVWPWFIGIAAILFVVVAVSDIGSRSSSKTKPVRPATSAAPSTVPAYRSMPGDGTHNMGGVDGKDWGVWRSSGARATDRPCTWSIRSVARYRGGLVLDSGEAAYGETVTVNIQPDGNVGLSGMIGDHRLVFMTHGCAPWSFVR